MGRAYAHACLERMSCVVADAPLGHGFVKSSMEFVVSWKKLMRLEPSTSDLDAPTACKPRTLHSPQQGVVGIPRHPQPFTENTPHALVHKLCQV